ncbi:response regulator transcription factor [Kineococcus gynurae]|uniref:Response regulator transcription factor n=1 Tax=Kineococcus gynurae TaxID=452979 RepID=A0ABV5LSG5_9ACTN
MAVAVAEDSAVVRDGLVRLLDAHGHRVVHAARDTTGLVEVVGGGSVDVALLDVRMPPSFTDEGVRAALACRELVPDFPVMLFSQHVEWRTTQRLVHRSSTGIGYLLKDRVADSRTFVRSLEEVAGGGTVIDPGVIQSLVGRRSGDDPDLERLGDRETQVLQLMAEGMSNVALAQQLGIAERSVEKHIANIFTKLGLEPSRTEHRRVLAVLKYLAGR